MKDCPKCGSVVDGLRCHVCSYVDPEARPEPRQRPNRAPHGPIDPRVLAEMRRILARPKPDPKEWARKILREAAAGTYTYPYGIECAREALYMNRERVPGEDDE